MFTNSIFNRIFAVGQRQKLPPLDPEGHVSETRNHSIKNVSV